MKKFTLEINLDNENEVADFLMKYGQAMGEALANSLGLPSLEGREQLANALHYYACNKKIAIEQRSRGQIGIALWHESICDSFYSEISALCECW